jgi:hypothetical protein
MDFTDRLHQILEDELNQLKWYYNRMIDNLEEMGAKVPVNLRKKSKNKE